MLRFLSNQCAQIQQVEDFQSTYRSAPAASTTTSSSVSDSRVINAPTIFLPWSKRRVDGSFCMRFETAAHAHLRSAASGASIYHKALAFATLRLISSAYFLYNRQNCLVFGRGCGCHRETRRKVAVRYPHRVVPALCPLLLRLAHGEDRVRAVRAEQLRMSGKTFSVYLVYPGLSLTKSSR